MSAPGARSFRIEWGDGGSLCSEVLQEENELRSGIRWRHVRVERVWMRHPGRDETARKVCRTLWIGEPVDFDAMTGVVPPRVIEALQKRIGPVETVGLQPAALPRALAREPREEADPSPGTIPASVSPLELAKTTARSIEAILVPHQGMLVVWGDRGLEETAAAAFDLRLAEMGMDPLGSVRALREMTTSLRQAITGRLREAGDLTPPEDGLPDYHPVHRLAAIETLLTEASAELDACIRRLYETRLPPARTTESTKVQPRNLREIAAPPLPRLPFLNALVRAAVAFGALWTEWQLAEDAMRSAALRAAAHRGGHAQRRWERADIEAVADGVRAGYRLDESCIAHLRALGRDLSEAEALARAYRRACRTDPDLPRPPRGRPSKARAHTRAAGALPAHTVGSGRCGPLPSRGIARSGSHGLPSTTY